MVFGFYLKVIFEKLEGLYKGDCSISILFLYMVVFNGIIFRLVVGKLFIII